MIKEGATVQVVMTDGAKEFITPLTMQALTGHTVYSNQWDDQPDNKMPHIDLTRQADAVVIAPCTANFMSKLANGLGDDLLSTLCLARPAHIPFIVAPAMNAEMWKKPATQRNLNQIKEDGALVMGPASGFQACGEIGDGRMLEPAQMLEEVIAALQPKVLKNRRILITAGPTFEPIDPVRGITNRSSGKMGYAIARAAREAGASVTLISGPTALDTPYHVNRVDVMTAIEMRDAVMSHISHRTFSFLSPLSPIGALPMPATRKSRKTKTGIPPHWNLPKIRIFWLPLQHCLILHIASALPPNRKN